MILMQVGHEVYQVLWLRYLLPWDGCVDIMRVEEEETSRLLVDVLISNKVKCHMIFATGDTYVLVNLE